MKKQSQKNRPARGAKNTDRAAVILSLFREFPNNKFSLKHLASASGGATKEGRRETFEILGRLHDEGIVEECAREKYRLTHKHLPHFEGIADMTASGSVYVRVEGEENDIFVNQRNTANALNGDRVEVVAIHRGRDGKFWFGGFDGIVGFDPSQHHFSPKPEPALYITGLSINNEEQSVGGEGSPLDRSPLFTDRITLAHNQSNISLRFAGTSFSQTGSIDYYYALEPVDTEWILSLIHI